MKLHLTLSGLISVIWCCGWIANAALPDNRVIDATEYADTVRYVRYVLATGDSATIGDLIVASLVGPPPAATGNVTVSANRYNELFGQSGTFPQMGWGAAERCFLNQAFPPVLIESWMFTPAKKLIPEKRGLSPAVFDATNEEEFTTWWRRMLRLRR